METKTREQLLCEFTELEEHITKINIQIKTLERKRKWYLAKKEPLRTALESLIYENSGAPLIPQNILDRSIQSLGLSRLIMGALKKESIETVGQLSNRTEKQLLCIPKIAKVSVVKIKKALSSVGCSLKECPFSDDKMIKR